MQVVNCVYKGRLQQPVHERLNLLQLSNLIPNSKLNTTRPLQLCVTCEYVNAKVILFSTGSLRVMGKGLIDESLLAYMAQQEVLDYFTEERAELTLQTMTITAKVDNWGADKAAGGLSFEKFKTQWPLNMSMNFELFSAIRLTEFDPVCVNLFSTGKIVMCGIKAVEQAQDILSTINTHFNNLKNL